MKRFFILLIAAMIGFGAVSCKEDPILPPVEDVCDVCGQDPCICESEDSENEITLTVPVEIMLGGEGWAQTAMPGEDILEFFDMTEDEFYAAMGTWSGDQAAGQSVQENNTIQFGLANENDHYDLKFVPATSNNFGHWVNSEAGLTWWTGQEANGAFYAYSENQAWWGFEASEEGYADDLEKMWTFNVGVDGQVLAAAAEGDEFKFTEVFYQVVEGEVEDIEKLCYVEWVIKFVGFTDPEAGMYDGEAEPGVTDITKAAEISIAEYPGYAAMTIDLTEVQEILQMTKFDMLNSEYVWSEDGSTLLSGFDYLFVQHTGEVIADYNNWVDVNGVPVGWLNENAVLCFNLALSGSEFNASICYEPANVNGPVTDEEGNTTGSTAVKDAVGKTVKFTHRFLYMPASAEGDQTKLTTVNVNYEITIVE